MKETSKKAVVLVAIVFLAASLIFLAVMHQQVEFHSDVHLVMGTYARVVVIAKNSRIAEKCVKTAFAEIKKVDDLMSDYKDDSEIGIANAQAFQRPVQMSKSTYEVIKKSVEYSKLTDGAFDITVGPLVMLFRQAKQTQIAPTAEQIEQAKSKVGYEKLVIDDTNRTVKFTVEGMRLDLGGIAKGYSADKAAEAMRQEGATGGMVCVGGEVRCFGDKTVKSKKWVIGIQDPNLENNGGKNLIMALNLTDGAVSTSGDYQQFVMINNQKYHHIIDRSTGSSEKGITSATIISQNAADTDALATSVSVLGAEKGLAIIEKIPDTEAILVLSQPYGKIVKSSGADKYIKK
jgi:FAD:protein FMN transferase